MQGRYLEEAHLLSYSETLICIAVDADVAFGSQLLQKQTQEKIRLQFGELFEFKGQLQVMDQVTAAEKQMRQGATSAAPDLPETLAAQKSRLQKERQENLKKEIYGQRNHPAAIKMMGGTGVTLEVTGET